MDLLEFLQHGTLTNEAGERALTQARSELLERVVLGEPVSEEVLVSFAQFCFDYEYVLAEGTGDTERLAKLQHDLSPHARLMVACFRPDGRGEALPVDEIESLRPLSDGTSRAVAHQYEEHPYPRWRFLPPVVPGPREAEILVAGCGTGREPLAIAKGAPQSRVVALDLSRKSLAYATAKAKDFGITNVRFIHGDILDVSLLAQTFDEIVCTGVLHHMAEPLNGLLALKNVLRPNGTMDVSVYSGRNRKSILEAIKLRKERGIPPTDAAIRSFRQEILALPGNHPARGSSTSIDFYSISGARDLLFHVCEHNFTPHSLAALIKAAGLTLLQFGGGSKPERRFREMGFSDPMDLDAWVKVEDAHPGTFSGMYRAVVGH